MHNGSSRRSDADALFAVGRARRAPTAGAAPRRPRRRAATAFPALVRCATSLRHSLALMPQPSAVPLRAVCSQCRLAGAPQRLVCKPFFRVVGAFGGAGGAGGGGRAAPARVGTDTGGGSGRKRADRRCGTDARRVAAVALAARGCRGCGSGGGVRCYATPPHGCRGILLPIGGCWSATPGSHRCPRRCRQCRRRRWWRWRAGGGAE